MSEVLMNGKESIGSPKFDDNSIVKILLVEKISL